MNNYRKGLKKTKKGVMKRSMRARPIDQKRFEVTEKDYH